MGGFFPDSGFVLKSSDDQFRLRFRLQSVIRGQVVMDGKATISNPFLTLRPVLEGNLYRPWIRFWTSLDLAANPVYLLDSYVEIQPIDQIGIRVGQQWTPFSRHEYLYGPHQLLLPEWDPIADYFWSGRDKGATLFGSLFGKKVDWFLGGYIGAPLRQFETIRGNYLFVARLAVNPLGTLGDTEFAYAEKDSPAPFRYSIGVNGYTSKLQRGVENFNPNSFSFDVTPSGLTTINHTIGADFILQSSRFTTLAEGYFRRTDERNGSPAFSSAGAFVQAGLLVYERLVDVSVRGTWADVNLQHDDDRTLGIEAASTYYIHGPMVAVKLRYAYADQKGVSGESTSGGAQLPVAPGHLHVLTAQLNTSF